MLTPKAYFITGTDTDVGKTYISLKLLAHFKQHGYSTLAMKPIASGCHHTDEGLRNEDALLLQAAATNTLPYKDINPFAFEPPIAPHIAAAQTKTSLTKSGVATELKNFLNHPADIHLIEGAGGWLLPLNNTETLADVITELQLNIILVVKMQLGCLNHALLTAQNIRARGLNLAGWVANTIGEPMPYLNENIHTLNHAIAVPQLLF